MVTIYSGFDTCVCTIVLCVQIALYLCVHESRDLWVLKVTHKSVFMLVDHILHGSHQGLTKQWMMPTCLCPSFKYSFWWLDSNTGKTNTCMLGVFDYCVQWLMCVSFSGFWSSLPVHLIMFSLKTMMASKATKQTSAAASKIKNKLLSESVFSFFFFWISEICWKKSSCKCQTQILSCFRPRYLVLLQGLFEDQQQSLSSGLASSEEEKQPAGDGGHAPAETSGRSLLWTSHQEIQAQKTGVFVVCLCSSTGVGRKFWVDSYWSWCKE